MGRRVSTTFPSPKRRTSIGRLSLVLALKDNNDRSRSWRFNYTQGLVRSSNAHRTKHRSDPGPFASPHDSLGMTLYCGLNRFVVDIIVRAAGHEVVYRTLTPYDRSTLQAQHLCELDQHTETGSHRHSHSTSFHSRRIYHQLNFHTRRCISSFYLPSFWPPPLPSLHL